VEVTAMEQVTKEQIGTAVGMVAAIAETVRELGKVPSGELYAQLMGTVSMQQYEQIIGLLKRAELVKVENHELVWIGPNIPKGGK
jgi:hypothetical protein